MTTANRTALSTTIAAIIASGPGSSYADNFAAWHTAQAQRLAAAVDWADHFSAQGDHAAAAGELDALRRYAAEVIAVQDLCPDCGDRSCGGRACQDEAPNCDYCQVVTPTMPYWVAASCSCAA